LQCFWMILKILFRKPQCYRPSYNFTRYWKYYECIYMCLYEHICIALCRWHRPNGRNPLKTFKNN
jgi:hypothetical protein